MKIATLPRPSGQLAYSVAPIIRLLLRSAIGYIFLEQVIEPHSSGLLTTHSLNMRALKNRALSGGKTKRGKT